MTRTIVIGDVHGCNETLRALLKQLRLRKSDALVFLGDYIDRGPDSKGVIDTVQALRRKGHAVTCLRGNHEQMLLDALADACSLEQWLFNGGRQTMASFQADRLRDMPEPYIDFLISTRYWYETDGYLFVHGGPDFSAPEPLGNQDSLLWMRRWYADINYAWLGNRIVLHGHTPMDIEPIREQVINLGQQQYLNLDNGCVYAGLSTKRGNQLGQLLAFCLETRELIEQQNVE